MLAAAPCLDVPALRLTQSSRYPPSVGSSLFVKVSVVWFGFACGSPPPRIAQCIHLMVLDTRVALTSFLVRMLVVYARLCLSVCASASMSVCLSVCTSVCLYVGMLVRLHAYLLASLYVRLAYQVCHVCLHGCLSACLLACLSVCLAVCMSA